MPRPDIIIVIIINHMILVKHIWFKLDFLIIIAKFLYNIYISKTVNSSYLESSEAANTKFLIKFGPLTSN